MFEGYLELGGNEIVNSARSAGYLASGDCPSNWIVCPPCPGILEATGGLPYNLSNIADAPWYDEQEEASHRFLGVHALSIEGLMDSTRTASIAEGIVDGGVVGQVRHAVRQSRVRVLLSALGEDALESGLAWLKAALDPEYCGIHGSSCGATDSCFFVACPPTMAEVPVDEDPDAYTKAVDALQRTMHDVTCISGPLIEQKLHRNDMWGYIVEFTLAAGTPWLFGTTRDVVIPPGQAPIVVQDVPFNLVPYPSAELSSGTVIVATNYSTNPSSEAGITGWQVSTDGTKILPAQVVVSQTNELASVGTYSAKALFTAPATNTGGWFGLSQAIALPGITPSKRYSANIWMSASIQSGTAVLGTVNAYVYWQDAAGTTLRIDAVGNQPATGGAVSAKSLLPPAGTTKALVNARVNVTSWSAGAIIRFYADALAVTVP